MLGVLGSEQDPMSPPRNSTLSLVMINLSTSGDQPNPMSRSNPMPCHKPRHKLRHTTCDIPT
jgi:hypothetical protein